VFLGKRCGAVQRAVGGLPPSAALLFTKLPPVGISLPVF